MEERRQIDPLTYPPGLARIEKGKGCDDRGGPAAGCGLCAICLEKIALQDMALVKGCEHAYCVTCSLRWASYSEKPSCPRCKHPFEFLNILRSLDGSIHDCMFEESVCLLLRTSWFAPMTVEAYDDVEEDTLQYEYDDELDDLDESYYYVTSKSSFHIGSRRWGDNGYVKAGRTSS